jgi:N-acetylglucosamine kinase-like BadF-type ATPase
MRRGQKTVNPLYVGVDGGGTKTEAVVTDARFRVLGKGEAGPSNFLLVGLGNAMAAVEDAVVGACASAGVRVDSVDVGGVGLAGVMHPPHHKTVYGALRRRLPVRSLVLIDDARAAVAGATDRVPSVVVIAGTGSVAFGIDAEGRAARVGGWGPILGDEGSAYDIARGALRAVVSAFDGRSAPTSLTARLCGRMDVVGPEDLPAVVYNPVRGSRQEIASLAVLVTEEARAGDAVARTLLERAGRDLGEIAALLVGKLGLAGEEFPVAYVGGVFKAGELVLAPLRERVARAAPRACVVSPLRDPAVGAAMIAAELGGGVLPTAVGG